LVNTVLGFVQNSVEKGQAATYYSTFLQSFVKIQEMYQPIGRNRLNSKENNACTLCLQNNSANSEAFELIDLT
jgi:hypothetical protein